VQTLTSFYDQATECDMDWKARLPEEGREQNFSQIIESIDAMVWPQGPTDTSMALTEAMAELNNHGRSDAKAVVVVLTDGLPYRPRVTQQKSEALMQRGVTVEWVPVGPGIADVSVFNAWASRPVEDHVVPVQEFAQLTQNSVLNKIISDFCIDVVERKTEGF
jgi:uncharacterized protein with von Willebrand factor type A (vWA) domain